MTVDLSDIEDICVTTPNQGSDAYTTNTKEPEPTVRIRKLKKVKVKSKDCEDGGCGDCSCGDGIKGLFDDDLSGRFVNGVVACEEEVGGDEAVEDLVGNDLKPGEYVVYLKTWGCSHNNSDSEYMAGVLHSGGFRVTTTDYKSSHVVILNSCTVKGPSEQHFKNEIARAVADKKRVILAGCVPQSDKSYRKIASVIGVQQIDRIVEVVEETLRGNKLTFISARRNGVRSAGADLSLPKIRKNELIEIVPISSGCLNNCTYCKTKQARGQLVSYSVESVVRRIGGVTRGEGVKEVWLTSEDLGCWGIDLGLNIVDLLNAIVECLPSDVMLRLGMTNPPYILDHLEEISRILSHPNVYEFLHIPVQSGSDSVLLEMKREYSRKDFERICDFMISRHPNITIATDIICGYPTETDEDFEDTYRLVEKYKFPVLFINQFYPRPGTYAAKLKRIPTEIVKGRTRRLNDLFQSYERIGDVVGVVQRVLVTEVAHDGVKYVGHNKSYQQVLVDKTQVVGGHDVMGEWVDVEIVGSCKFAMIGGRTKLISGAIPTSEPNKNSNVIALILMVMLIFLSVYMLK